MSIKHKRGGFTLIELLVVIAIISLLSAVLLNSLASARMKTADTKISQDLRQFRIAAELYFNDNHEYPPITMDYKNIELADRGVSTKGWSDKLSFFVKTAKAASRHNTKLCSNFDDVADTLVLRKYMSAVPVHPYDDDSKGICYKAVNSGTTFASYAVLTTRVSVSPLGGSTQDISKREGFILGDTSPSGMQDLQNKFDEFKLGPAVSLVDQDEIAYPIDETTSIASDISSSVDSINGITTGALASSEGDIIGALANSGIVLTIGSWFDGGTIGNWSGGGTITLTPSPSVLVSCPAGSASSLGGLCVNNPPAGCPGSVYLGACPIGYVPTYSCPIGKQYQLNGLENTANGTCESVLTVIGPPSGGGVLIMPNQCLNSSILTTNNLCRVGPPGCLGSNIVATCGFSEQEQINRSSYTCPSGKQFVIDGFQNTANGSCIAI